MLCLLQHTRNLSNFATKKCGFKQCFKHSMPTSSKSEKTSNTNHKLKQPSARYTEEHPTCGHGWNWWPFMDFRTGIVSKDLFVKERWFVLNLSLVISAKGVVCRTVFQSCPKTLNKWLDLKITLKGKMCDYFFRLLLESWLKWIFIFNCVWS